MFEFLTKLLDTQDFVARWQSGPWSTGHSLLHVVSEVATWGAFMAIGCVMVYFLAQRKDVAFSRVLWLFTAFILICGVVHLVEALTFWWPAYRLSGLLKFVMALTSWVTVIALVPVVPRALALKAPEELAAEVGERRRAEHALRESEALYHSLVEDLPLNVFRKDLQGRFVFANQQFCETVGKPLKELIGKTDGDLFRRELAEKYHKDDAEVLRTGKLFEDVEQHHRADGKRIFVQVFKVPLRDADGQIRGVQGVFWDVSKQKQAEEALRDSELRIRAIFEAAVDCIIFTNQDGKIVEFNRAAEKTFGYSRREAIGAEMAELFIPPSSRGRHRGNIAGYSQEGRVGSLLATRFETEVMRKNGEQFLGEMTMQPIPLRGTAGFAVFLQDITRRKAAEEALKQSEERSRRIVETAYDAFIGMDTNGLITDWNAQSQRTFGWSRQEAVGKKLAEMIIPPRYVEAHTRGMKRFVETGKGSILNKRIETTALRRDRKEFPVELTIWPIRVEGQYHFYAFVHDITKRKQAEEALDHERYLLHTLMDNLPDAIYFKDTAGRFLRVSKALARSCGLGGADEMVGKTDFDFFPKAYSQLAFEDEQQIMTRGTPMLNKEEQPTWPDGSEGWCSTTKVPLRDNWGKVIGTFGISHDISVQKRAAEALEEAKDAAEAANRAKSLFLANMSHEIRTPMNAIIGITDLLLESRLSGDQREYLNLVMESAESLLFLIEDILDFSKIEAGKLDLDFVRFDLRESLGDAMKLLAFRAHSKELELACHVAPEVPETVVGDPGRLRQVIVNLVGNAIKFTERGEVVLDIAVESMSQEEVVLHFAVRDTGIGIPRHKQSAIFEAFEQADNSTTRRFGGTGLGLAISSRLVELLGGRIGVESEPGRGSTFHFTARFNLPEEARPDKHRPGPVDLHDLRVLVVDDNATNRMILEEMLGNWQIQVEAAPGAREALAQMHRAQQGGRPFGLVILDAQMPDTNGFQLAEQIQQQADLDGTIIMMLSSGDRPSDIAHCQQLGIAVYRMKPIKQSELFDAMGEALGTALVGQREPAEPLIAPPLIAARRLQVLLAEDSLVNQKLAVGLLQSRGHGVTVASSGTEAIAALKAQSFDLVLMDVQMPDMDGMEATINIRKQEQQTGVHVPIVAMTAHAMKGDRERCLAAGMDGYISKPIRAKELFAAIDAIFADSTEPKPASQREPPEAEALDWRVALETVQGDRQLLGEMIEAFLQESPGLLEQIRNSISSQDAATLRRAAHTLKGSLRYFGARRAFDHAGRLEAMGQKRDLADALETARSLQGEMAGLKPLLQSFLDKPGSDSQR